jgi:hypothetical protein
MDVLALAGGLNVPYIYIEKYTLTAPSHQRVHPLFDQQLCFEHEAQSWKPLLIVLSSPA